MPILTGLGRAGCAATEGVPVSETASRDQVELDTQRRVDRMMLIVITGMSASFFAASLVLDFIVGAPIPRVLHGVLFAHLCLIVTQAAIAGRTRSERGLQRLRDVNLALAVCLSLAVTFVLGGVAWVGPSSLFVVLFRAASSDGRSRSLLAAGGMLGGFVGVSALQAAGVIPAHRPFAGGGDPTEGAALVAGLVLVALSMLTFYAVAHMAAHLARRQRELLATTSAELAASKRDLEALNRDLEARVAAKMAELESQHRELTVIAEIGKIVNGSLDIERAYAGFMRESHKLLPFDQASVAVLTPEGDRLRLLRVRAIDGGFVEDAHVISTAASIQATGEARVVADLRTAMPFMERDSLLRDGVESMITMPITSKGAVLGSFNIASNTPRAYGAEHLRLMQRISEPFALAIANIRLYAEMRALAESDVLTGLPNRRTILQRIHAEIARSRRSGQMTSVLMMDLDNFKLFNDMLGHQAGDELLVTFSELLSRACRETDVVARQSGDEFIVLLPETNPADAMVVAQRIHEALASSAWCYPGQAGVHVTTSIGIATFPLDAGDDETLLRCADSAMYRAKANGGGQTELASENNARRSASDGPRQMRFGVIETIANLVAMRTGEEGAEERALAARIARFAMLVAGQMDLAEGDRRVLRLAALTHALGIAPDSAAPGVLGADPALDETHLRLGRLFVAASPGLGEAMRASQFHRVPAPDIAGGEMLPARIIGVAEGYARALASGATEDGALASLRDASAYDQRVVEELARALAHERAHAA